MPTPDELKNKREAQKPAESPEAKAQVAGAVLQKKQVADVLVTAESEKVEKIPIEQIRYFHVESDPLSRKNVSKNLTQDLGMKEQAGVASSAVEALAAIRERAAKGEAIDVIVLADEFRDSKEDKFNSERAVTKFLEAFEVLANSDEMKKVLENTKLVLHSAHAEDDTQQLLKELQRISPRVIASASKESEFAPQLARILENAGITEGRNEQPKKKESEQHETLARAKEEKWFADHFLHELTGRGHDWHPVVSEEKNRKPIYGEREPYSVNWKNLLERATEEEIRLLKRKLHGKILIDLGGGISFDEKGKQYPPPMQDVAHKLGVAVYVNVDRALKDDSPWKPHAPQDITEDLSFVAPKGMHIAYTENDMLEFIMQMEDATPNVAFALNGVDGLLIPSRSYHSWLTGEITRVLPKDGVVLTCGSEDAVESYEWRDGLRLILGPEKAWPAYPQMWEKK